MHGSSVIVVHHVFRPDSTLQILEVGAQLPVHASALGKAILAYAPGGVVDDLMAEPLPKLTSRTLSARELRNQFASIRKRGVARERDEAILGESSVAGPIFDRAGHAVGRRRRGGGHGAHRAPRAGHRADRGGRRGREGHLARAWRAVLAGPGRARRVSR